MEVIVNDVDNGFTLSLNECQSKFILQQNMGRENLLSFASNNL